MNNIMKAALTKLALIYEMSNLQKYARINLVTM